MPDSGLVFDEPGGRIVEAFARGDVTAQAVIAFYDGALPQLGWRREAPGAYLREGERLKLDLSQDARGVTVQFKLFPQSGADAGSRRRGCGCGLQSEREIGMSYEKIGRAS